MTIHVWIAEDLSFLGLCHHRPYRLPAHCAGLEGI